MPEIHRIVINKLINVLNSKLERLAEKKDKSIDSILKPFCQASVDKKICPISFKKGESWSKSSIKPKRKKIRAINKKGLKIFTS